MILDSVLDGVEDLCQAIDAVLTGMRGNAELFERLLCLYAARIKAVLEANGGPTDH